MNQETKQPEATPETAEAAAANHKQEAQAGNVEPAEQAEQVEQAEPAAQAQDAVETAEAEAAPEPAALLETIVRLEAELTEARARADDVLDKYQRMAAEFQNSRRRQERQLAEEIDRASAHLIKRLLPVLDDFDLAFDNVPETLDGGEPWVEGFRQIQRKLRALLEDEGITPIPAAGEFNPELHEAVTSESSDSVESGHIIDTLRAGYMHKGRVLRPALVRVAL